jgi:hypothetical protein
MEAEQKVIAGGVLAGISLVMAGILIGARILGVIVPCSGYLLILSAVFVVAGVIVINQYAEGSEGHDDTPA